MNTTERPGFVSGKEYSQILPFSDTEHCSYSGCRSKASGLFKHTWYYPQWPMCEDHRKVIAKMYPERKWVRLKSRSRSVE